MGYYRAEWTEERVRKRLAEGRGLGIGADYQPMLEVFDVPSLGLARRIWGLKSKRVHHLLSNNEFYFFLMLDWAQDVIDIREQFPLDRDLTEQVAVELRIAHPCYPGTHVPIVMTVDFLVTRMRYGQEVYEAFDVKASDGAEDDGRTAQKLEIARQALENMDVPHDMVFSSKLPRDEIANLEWIRGGSLIDGEDRNEPYSGFYAEHQRLMSIDLENTRSDVTLSQYCEQYDARCGQRRGTGLAVAKQLMEQRVLIPTLGPGDLAYRPLSAFALGAARGALRVAGGGA